MLARASCHQRTQIEKYYNKKHSVELKEALKDVLGKFDSRYFKDAVLGLFDTNPELCARFSFHRDNSRILIRNKDILIPFLCSCSAEELLVFKESLNEFHSFDVSRGDYSYYFSPLMRCMLKANRTENESIKDVRTDAESLRPNFSVEHFTKLLTTRTFDHLRAVFVRYKQLEGKDITCTIETLQNSEQTQHLLQIVKCIKEQFLLNFKMMENSRSVDLHVSLIYAAIKHRVTTDESGDFKLASYILTMFPYDNSLCHLLLSLCQVSNSSELV